ncbi:MAG: AAA family ATPase [Marinilabiliaceae bacterium]|nr:AAA family ATPase [Marinilabiliaceae bacterium]
MKTITFILQSKGGVGKSAFAYLLANKYKEKTDLLVVDMDNETNTASNQLKFMSPLTHNLIDTGTKTIDRSSFDTFFENFIHSDKFASALCDLGATTSEQFVVFLKENGDEIIKELVNMGIRVQICCVIAGQNAFPASSEYCRELFQYLSNADVTKFIIKNNYYEFTQEQTEALQQLSELTNSKIQEFNIVPGNVPGTLKEVHALMEEGIALENAKTFTKIRLKSSMDSIFIEC